MWGHCRIFLEMAGGIKESGFVFFTTAMQLYEFLSSNMFFSVSGLQGLYSVVPLRIKYTI